MTQQDMDELADHLGKRVNVLPSSLFLKDKKFADGLFDKLKSRLVCCGNFQLILDAFGAAGTASSPTVNLVVVFIVLSLCSYPLACNFDASSVYQDIIKEKNLI